MKRIYTTPRSIAIRAHSAQLICTTAPNVDVDSSTPADPSEEVLGKRRDLWDDDEL